MEPHPTCFFLQLHHLPTWRRVCASMFSWAGNLGIFCDCWEIKLRCHRWSFKLHLPRKIILGPSRLRLDKICHIYRVTFLTESQTLKDISKGKTLSDRTRTLQMKDVVLPLIYFPVQPCKDLSRVSVLIDGYAILVKIGQYTYLQLSSLSRWHKANRYN